MFSFLAGTFFLWRSGLLAGDVCLAVLVCAGSVALVGFIDDYRHLSAGIRICLHTAAAIGVFFFINESFLLNFSGLPINLGIVGDVIAVVSFVWLLNLYNFMDGIDGIAGMETICVAGGGAFIIWLNDGDQAYVLWFLLLVASTGGFLFWNWPPAKIFMGDACSGFLGFVLGLMAIVSSAQGGITVWSWLILLAFFLTDATVTLIRRICRREKFYEAHRSHAYQILSRRLNSHLKVTLVCMFINLFWLFPLACLASYCNEWGVILVLIAFAPLVGLALKLGAGTTDD